MSRKMTVTMYRSSNGSLKLFMEKVAAQDYVNYGNKSMPSSFDKHTVEKVAVLVKVLHVGVINECG